MTGNVECKARRRVASGPFRGYFVRVRIDTDDLTLVLDVVEDGALAVNGSEFRLAG